MARILFSTIGAIGLAAALCCCAASPTMTGSPMQEDFSWVIPDDLAGMSRPGSSFPIDQDMEFLAAEGIDLLVSLTEEPTPADEVEAKGMELLHVPIQDFTAPTMEQMELFVERAAAEIDGGGAVGVHCAGGHGRTGTMLAVYLVHTGMTAEEAIARVRELRPGSIETPSQEAAVHKYYMSLDSD